MAKSPTVPFNLYVPESIIRAIDRWLAYQVLYKGKSLGDVSRSAEIERVIAAEAARIKRLTGRRTEALPDTEGPVVQVNQRVPAHLLETIDGYAHLQQQEHGHNQKSFNRARLIIAALQRDAERLQMEMDRLEKERLASKE